MLIFILLIFSAVIAVAAIVISVLAKRRRDGSVERPKTNLTEMPKMGRASGGDD